jgi:uncharacterized membrane protein
MVGDAPQPGWLETTPDERSMATLAHALQPIGSWIAPLIIFVMRRQSRFVAFHALQALLLQILKLILFVLLIVGFFVTMFSYLTPHLTTRPNEFPTALFVFFPLVWLSIMAMSIGILVIAILYSIKAARGEWADYPVLGKLARKILKMAPKELQ